MRRPEEQWEMIVEANVRPGWSARRPESDIEAEMNDEWKRRKK